MGAIGKMGPRKAFGAAALWAALAVAAAAPAGAQDVENGERLFHLCANCHGGEGQGAQETFAPSIAGLPAWYVENQLRGFRQGYRGQHFDDVTGMRMRPMALWLEGDEEIRDVAAYVASLPPADPARTLDGDPARGQALYAPCIACHGPEGKGNQALNAPPLTGVSDWYALTQLQNFKAGIRGAKPGDATGALMRPMAMTLPDPQAMRDVIAYVMTLGR